MDSVYKNKKYTVENNGGFPAQKINLGKKKSHDIQSYPI